VIFRIVAVGFLLVVAACGGVTPTQVVQVPSEKMKRLSSAYVSQPENGRYQTKYYAESGRQVAAEVLAAFAGHLGKIQQAQGVESQDAALSKARKLDVDYLIYPEILHWEDRATEWSGRPDRLSLRVTVFKTSDGTQLSSGVVGGNSSWFTLGGDHPQDMLPNVLKPYVTGLF